MTRIPSHTRTEAPAASRPLLEGAARSSPTGQPLNLHAQLAHSPTVLAAYTSIREAAGRAGQVSDVTWERAAACGWTSAELAEAFAYLALTIFTAYFLNYAQTPNDLASTRNAVTVGANGTE